MSKAHSRVFVHRECDRRVNQNTVQFPLLDSDFNIVRKDRRRIADRRKANLKLIWQENQPIRHTSELNIVANGKNYFFDSNLDEFTLGRAKECNLCLVNKYISKHHAHIKYRNGEFVLQDNSRNGTFIETEELGKVRIQGQKVYLFGDGKISLGTPIDREYHPVIYFHCH